LFPENSTVADGPALKYKNILIVRTDRIGDVVLTLPLVQVLRKNFPEARISFLIRSYTNDIVQGQPGLDDVVLYDREGTQKPFLAMLFELRHKKFDLAIVAYPRLRVALLLRFSGVVTRIGTGYRWYSLLFNKRIYEHRKTGERHEFEYNLSLLRGFGCHVDPALKPSVALSEAALESAAVERKRLQLSSRDIVAILHPGSGGSARDWSAANFRSLAFRLANLGWKVVVTGAQGEESLVRNVANGSNRSIVTSVGKLSLRELAAFIQTADLFVSNSTGPLHIAAAVGTPVIGFYPPIPACSFQRWGPVIDQKVVFAPDRERCELCKGRACSGNFCMDQIAVDQVIDAAYRLVKKKSTKSSRAHVHI